MKIRNPFKDYFLRWKDDATDSEKFIWGVSFAGLGMMVSRLFNLGELLRSFFSCYFVFASFRSWHYFVI